jgi:anti-sigma factor ChrR (cupin superfamily)
MKEEREFTPVADIPFTPTEPFLEGLDERIVVSAGKPGIVTRMLRFAPGLDTSPNGTLTHDFWEEVYILQGEMTDLRLSETFSAGDYACRPPGMEHGPWRAGDQGCLTFEVRYSADTA